MLNLTERAGEELKRVFETRDSDSARLRVFIDHRCHCGKAHFSLALAPALLPGDMSFEVAGVPFVADGEALPELGSVEIDYLDSEWTKGFTIRNVEHQCGRHMMGQ